MSDLDTQIEILIDAAEQITEARAGRNPEEDPKLAQSGLDLLNELFVSIFGTEIEKGAFPTYVITPEGHEDTIWTKEGTVIYAAWEFSMYGNSEPFAKCIQAGNPYLLKSQKARGMLSGIVRGYQSNKHLLRRREKDIKGAQMMEHLALLKMQGCPICTESKKKAETAIHKVSELFHMSPEAVRKHIWEARKR